MAMTIVLQDERGTRIERVDDPTNALASCLLGAGMQCGCLRYIDPYGDTVFNRLQLEDVLRELEALSATAPTEGHALLDQVAGLARRGLAEPHRYLKFIGD